jgi:hypothetical protein
VRERGRVVEDDRDLAGLRGERALVELQGAARVGAQLQSLRRATTSAARATPAGLLGLRIGRAAARAAVVVIIAAAARDWDRERTCQGDEGEGAHVLLYAGRAAGVQ